MSNDFIRYLGSVVVMIAIVISVYFVMLHKRKIDVPISEDIEVSGEKSIDDLVHERTIGLKNIQCWKVKGKNNIIKCLDNNRFKYIRLSE